jgi:hypothetical protein
MIPEDAAKPENRAKVHKALKDSRPVKKNDPLIVGDKVRILQKPSRARRFDFIDWSLRVHTVKAVEIFDGTRLYTVTDPPANRSSFLRHELLRVNEPE